jgi:hypothetical protein
MTPISVRKKPRKQKRSAKTTRKRERRRNKDVSYTEKQLTAMRGGLTVGKYRAKFLKKWDRSSLCAAH